METAVRLGPKSTGYDGLNFQAFVREAWDWGGGGRDIVSLYFTCFLMYIQKSIFSEKRTLFLSCKQVFTWYEQQGFKCRLGLYVEEEEEEDSS